MSAATITAAQTGSEPTAPDPTTPTTSVSRFSTVSYRLTGAALIGSFVTSLAGGVLHPVVDGHSHSVAALTDGLSPYAQLGIYLGALLLMVGLPGAYAWLAPRTNRLTLVGLGMYFLGNALSAQSHLVVEAFVAPAIARDAAARHLIPADGSIVDSGSFLALQSIGGLVLLGGLLVTGIGLLRAAGYRWIGAVLTVGAVLCLTPLPEVQGLTGLQIELCRGLGVAAIGALMLRSTRA